MVIVEGGSWDATLPLKEELSVDIAALPGMEDILKVVGRLRPVERVQWCIVEKVVLLDPRATADRRAVDLSLLPESSVEVARFSPRGRVQQRTVEQVVLEPQPRQETVEAVRSIQFSVEQTRLDLVEAVKIVPQKGISERMCLGVRVNRSGLLKHPRLQAKTGVCRVQWIGPSWTVSRLPKLPFGSEFLKGCVNSSALSRCPRTLARKMWR